MPQPSEAIARDTLTQIDIFKQARNYSHDHTTVFCNKYEEDDSIETVAFGLATIISEVETAYNIDEIDEEIDQQEIYQLYMRTLKNIFEKLRPSLPTVGSDKTIR